MLSAEPIVSVDKGGPTQWALLATRESPLRIRTSTPKSTPWRAPPGVPMI